VENLSCEDAQAFLDALNKLEDASGGEFRFPTEAEWEYACRAGSTGHYCFGNDETALNDYAWFYNGVKDESTHPVGQKKPNSWGLYDMHGNVSEWCADEWHHNYTGAPCNGSAWQDGDGDRIARGGHFSSSAISCRSASRDGREPNRRFEFVGLRVARTANE
jgi:formylglycine-generating enzyme required for sulfatase activity